jgi:hypothetical protein
MRRVVDLVLDIGNLLLFGVGTRYGNLHGDTH